VICLSSVGCSTCIRSQRTIDKSVPQRSLRRVSHTVPNISLLGLARGERPEGGEVWVGSTLILHFVWVPHCPILQPFREEMVWRDGPCEVEPFRNHLVGMLVYARLVAYVASICWHAPRNRVSDPSFDFSFALLGQGTVSGAQRSRWSPFSHRQHNILAYAHPHSSRLLCSSRGVEEMGF